MTNMYIEKLDTANPPNTIAIYTIANNLSFIPQYDAPVTPMPLPQNADTQNILIKVEGNSSTIAQTWIMKNYQSSLPPNASAYTGFVAITANNLSVLVKSAFDQVVFWKQFILPIQLTDAYRLTVADSVVIAGGATPTVTTVNGVKVLSSVQFVTTGASNYDGSNPNKSSFFYQEYGTITKLAPNMTGDSPLAFNATMNFQVGNVVSAYNLNVPTAPQNVTLTAGAGGSGQITIAWTAPQDVSGGITKYQIYRRTWNDSQILVKDNATSPYVDTTTPTLVYYYTVVAFNSHGQGISSTEVSITSP